MTSSPSPLQSHAAKASQGGSPILRRVVPLVALAVIAVLVFWFDLDRYLTFAALKEHRHALVDLVERQMVFAIMAYITIYAVATAVSLPGGAILSISGGFLFGPWFGTLWVVIAATVGATAIFSIARTALGEPLRRRAGPALRGMEAGFRENAFSYLLTLRLIPLFPFFLVNLVPAFLGVNLRSYVLATSIGVIPGAFVFASSGVGLGSVFDSAGDLSVKSVLTPEILIALTGLGLLSLLPVAYKRLRKHRAL